MHYSYPVLIPISIILFVLCTIFFLNKRELFAEEISRTAMQNPILLYYFARVPYSITTESGDVTGLVASPAAQAFRRAGIPFQWKKMPFKRQVETINHNKKMACGVGWFKTPEREAFALFTREIYQDRPTITLSKAGNSKLEGHQTLASLLSDKNIKLLTKIGFSYGTYRDGMVEQYAPSKVSVPSNNVQMLQMILAGRADYFFVSEEEAENLITSSGFDVSQFQKKHYSDMPEGNRRYIACSKQVSTAIIDLLNKSLK